MVVVAPSNSPFKAAAAASTSYTCEDSAGGGEEKHSHAKTNIDRVIGGPLTNPLLADPPEDTVRLRHKVVTARCCLIVVILQDFGALRLIMRESDKRMSNQRDRKNAEDSLKALHRTGHVEEDSGAWIPNKCAKPANEHIIVGISFKALV